MRDGGLCIDAHEGVLPEGYLLRLPAQREGGCSALQQQRDVLIGL